MKRDAKKDLEMCKRATPGPWHYDGMHNEIQTPYEDSFWLITSECRSTPDQDYPSDQFSHKYDANYAFIAMARDALPYWIKRAIRMELALEQACKQLEAVANQTPMSSDDPKDICPQCYYKEQTDE